MDDESEDGSATEPISPAAKPAAAPAADPTAEPAAEPKTQRLAGRAYPLLLRILFRDDPSSQLAARSASQLAGRSAHLHLGESRTLVPELRGHCEPVVGPFGHVASGASQSGGVRLLQKKKGPRASIGFRTRDALAAASGCGGPGGGIGGVAAAATHATLHSVAAARLRVELLLPPAAAAAGASAQCGREVARALAGDGHVPRGARGAVRELC
jgi:hypothetical protein